MEIAVPVDNNIKLYRKNPFSAPKFAIFRLDIASNVIVSKSAIVENPLAKIHTEFSQDHINCTCVRQEQFDLKHICEHYAVLDVIGKTTFLLASNYCPNLSRCMKNVGIKIYKIPPIIQELETAIKNFLIGASYAYTIQEINYAS